MCYGYDGHSALCEAHERRGSSRRSFLRGAAASAIGATAVGAGAAAPAAARTRPTTWTRVPPQKISIQLYTLRSVMTTPSEVDNTLETLGHIGYPRVELAGLYGRTAKQMRRTLRRSDVRGTSSHDGISADRAAMHAKFENAAIIGQRFMNVPYLNSQSHDEWLRWAEQMNKEGEVARKQYDLRYGYHNHAHEFTIDLGNGYTPWQLLTDELDPRYVHLEADLYWVVTGGIESGDGASDPEQFVLDVIDQAPQKVLQYHVKDRDPRTGDTADLDTYNIEFDRIFEAHRAEEYIVENDTPDVTPIRTARVGYDYLRRVRF